MSSRTYVAREIEGVYSYRCVSLRAQGVQKLRGENLKVVWAEFSTLSVGVFIYTL